MLSEPVGYDIACFENALERPVDMHLQLGHEEADLVRPPSVDGITCTADQSTAQELSRTHD